MNRPIILLTGLLAAGVLAVFGALYLGQDQNALNVHFTPGHSTSTIFLPARPRAEERIIRHSRPDGSAYDDTLMRDGTTKIIDYDTQMAVRHVLAYFKADPGQERGAPMYEKWHDEHGHLSAERHLRQDGSLEMDGHLNRDSTYVRHVYFPAALADAKILIVSAEQIFDKWWHPTAETEFRPDGTKQLVHTWGDGLEETFNNFAGDSNTRVSQVVTKPGSYYAAVYYADGVNIKVEGLNTDQGTTFQWYRTDNTTQLKVTFDSRHVDQIILFSDSGKPLVRQVWCSDLSQPPVNGQYPMRLDHLDHFNDEGNVDSRYDFDTTTHRLSTVLIYHSDSVMGPHDFYTVGIDGYATSIKTYDADEHDDGDEPVSGANRKHFVLDPWMLARPQYELPPMKDGLSLYSQHYTFFGR